jgi:cell fate (sporulation/competence/biofilm development) regulator YmcA (YheA/YmcA/DUF963 family)
LPGTLFYEKVKAEMLQKTNWTDSDELKLMFSNTYQPSFYKQLHRYVHKNYRTQLALQQVRTLIKNPAAVSFRKLKKAASVLYYLPASFIARQKLQLLEKN